ncbi:N-ethylammeline chlorohydrolase [Microbacterium mangrovi]|uniref:N-ethylammeline chlorohydrolase n=1 Tax=Microbacterium mangrovi TaxID=1348253 RepID=A0A0B2A8U0_9MICO|nr:chlorohydrolase family protein [Microbacterium mangrovi]KHK99978.1 N-ethylammeline chlorohydrolase [Microbacterium mangrovi]
MTTLLTADHVLVAQDGAFSLRRAGAVLVYGGTIAWVGAAADAPDADERIDLGEALLMPGLIDLEGLADVDHLQLDSWSDEDASPHLRWSRAWASHPASALSDEDRAVMRRYAVAQLALHGVTSFLPIASEIHTDWAETHDDLVDVARAAQEFGIRAFLGPSYRSGVHVTDDDGSGGIFWDDARGQAGFAEAVRFLDTVAAWDDPLITGVLAPCRIETLREELLAETGRVATERGALVRVHAFQWAGERSHFRRESDATQLEVLERCGLLNDRLIIAHGAYLDLHSEVDGVDGGELAAVAASGASIVHCPLTNARYAMWLEDFARYRDAGVNLALGSDSFPPDMIRSIDQGVSLAKAQRPDRPSGSLAEYIEAATLGGAAALHRPDLGRVEAGAAADLVAFSLADVRLGAVEDPIRTLVLAGTARDAVFSMVAGRVVMRDGLLPGVDLEQLRRDGQRIFDRLRASYAERDYAGSDVDELFPPVFPQAR